MDTSSGALVSSVAKNKLIYVLKELWLRSLPELSKAEGKRPPSFLYTVVSLSFVRVNPSEVLIWKVKDNHQFKGWRRYSDRTPPETQWKFC